MVYGWYLRLIAHEDECVVETLKFDLFVLLHGRQLVLAFCVRQKQKAVGLGRHVYHIDERTID
jgi:hypothetical protein